MTEFRRIFCIDGSGNKNEKSADRKRPIYCVRKRSTGSCPHSMIYRVDLGDKKAYSFFEKHCKKASETNRILIVADVVIGLPSESDLVWNVASDLPTWLSQTALRIEQNWRDEIIANSIDVRDSQRPFTKVTKGNKSQIAQKRLCDKITNGESVFCIDSGAKQVGRASLQFWFEVLCPLRERFPEAIAIWPFESIDEKAIVVAECYPVASQDYLRLEKGIKRNPPKVVKEVLKLRKENTDIMISEATWFHAVSSEDEYDMFTTSLALARQTDLRDLFWFPRTDEVKTKEGWMIGLKKDEVPPKDKREKRKALINNKSKPTQKSYDKGKVNRNDQESLGLSGNSGSKGPKVKVTCRRKKNDKECGYQYETNTQDFFQIKCPKCQPKNR